MSPEKRAADGSLLISRGEELSDPLWESERLGFGFSIDLETRIGILGLFLVRCYRCKEAKYLYIGRTSHQLDDKKILPVKGVLLGNI